MEVTDRGIGDITPYPGNPRKITDQAVETVARSIAEFGFRQPIVVDCGDMIIVGHTRFLAAQSLGLEVVPVHVMDCTEQQTAAYRLADNRLGEQTDWDLSKLSDELRHLEEQFDMRTLGFTDLELEMSQIDDLAIMTGETEEPWGGDPDAYVSEKQELPRCVVYFGTEKAQRLFFAWLATQDANHRKQQSKNETYVAYMPARAPKKFKHEAD